MIKMFTSSLAAVSLIALAAPGIALAQDSEPEELQAEDLTEDAEDGVEGAAEAVIEAESDVEAGAAEASYSGVEDAVAAGVADAMAAVEAMVLEDADEAVEEDSDGPIQTYILAANTRFLAEYGDMGWLSPELEICLEEGEMVQLARPATEIAAMELRGPLCTRIADAQDVASIVIDRAEAPISPVRGGNVRGGRGGGSSALFRVATGSPEVMEAYPRGTVVRRSTEICLEAGQQVTLISTSGQRVTYRGPGCARRETRPSGSNLGGFTFGWNDIDLRLHTVRRL